MSLRDDLDYDTRDDAYDYPPERPERPRRRLLPLLLAGGGIALFSGVIWYAYTAGKQTAVGPDGVTPLIQANQAPTKQRPDQPGGMEVPHQDKLVYDRLTPDASAPPAVERLLPPPEAPVPRPVLTPQQQVAQLQQQLQAPAPGMAGMQGMQGMAGMLGMQGMGLPAAPPQPPGMAGNQAAALPPVPATTPEPRPSGPPRTAAPAKPPATKPVEAKPAPAAAAPAKPPAAEAKPAPAKPPAAEAKPAAVAKPPAAAAGGFRVQLASVRTEEEAQSEWKRFQAHHKGQLGNLTLVVKKTDLGEKGVFYRVQGGGVDEARAKAICAELKGQNVGCQVVKP